ncbi:MAG TPA: hypothetical protein VF018_08400, partial [Acidobacteriaceae bacterium]
ICPRAGHSHVPMLWRYQITSRIAARGAQKGQQTRLAAHWRNLSHRFHRVVALPAHGLELHLVV